MRTLKFASLAALAIFGLALVWQSESARTDAGEKGKVHRLFLGSVKVATTTKDGKAWDINDGKPDLFVRITNESDKTIKAWESQEKTDTYEATFNQPTILVSEGQQVRIEVLDKDVALNDTIGTMLLKVNAESLKQGKADLKFDQVLSLKLEFRTP